MSHAIYTRALAIILFCCSISKLVATSLQIFNDTQDAFLISDHQSQAIIVPPQQSYNFNLTQKKSLYCYCAKSSNVFTLLCTLTERFFQEQSLKLLTSNIISQNFLLYPNLFFIQSNTISTVEKDYTNLQSLPGACPKNEHETQTLLQVIKQQQLIARESFQGNVPAQPKQTVQEDMAQKISAFASSRNQNVHQFARSSRKK